MLFLYIHISDGEIYSGAELTSWTFPWDLTLWLLICSFYTWIDILLNDMALVHQGPWCGQLPVMTMVLVLTKCDIVMNWQKKCNSCIPRHGPDFHLPWNIIYIQQHYLDKPPSVATSFGFVQVTASPGPSQMSGVESQCPLLKVITEWNKRH